MKILNKVFANIWKAGESYELFTPKNTHSVFTLKYKNLEVGKLILKNGEWIFEYSEEFKSQDNLKALVDFPTKNKTYKSEALWPFFSSRIPSTNTPSVKEVARKRNIDTHNEVQMLKEFGGRTITNPYLLTAV